MGGSGVQHSPHSVSIPEGSQLDVDRVRSAISRASACWQLHRLARSRSLDRRSGPGLLATCMCCVMSVADIQKNKSGAAVARHLNGSGDRRALRSPANGIGFQREKNPSRARLRFGSGRPSRRRSRQAASSSEDSARCTAGSSPAEAGSLTAPLPPSSVWTSSALRSASQT